MDSLENSLNTEYQSQVTAEHFNAQKILEEQLLREFIIGQQQTVR